jgi:hypothetical protein
MELRQRLTEAFRGVNGGPGHLADIALEAMSEDPTWAILLMVYDERVRQEAEYGHLNDGLEDGTGPDREDYDKYEDENGLPTWMHLVREEIAEAFELEASDPNFVTEIIQVSALCASWAERRSG